MRRRRTAHIDELAQLDWVTGLSGDALRSVARHIDRCDLPAGTRVQRAGMRARWIWIVLGGALEANGELVLPGHAWGERDVVLGEPSAVDVCAPRGATVLSLPASSYHGLLAEPSFAAAATRRLARASVVVA